MRKTVTVVQVTDDLDGTQLSLEDAMVAKVGWEGRWYELDVSTANYTAIESMLIELLPEKIRLRYQASRRSSTAPRVPQPRRNRQFYLDLRDWAASEGRKSEIKAESNGRGGIKYNYGRQLIADFIAERHPELAEHGEEQKV